MIYNKEINNFLSGNNYSGGVNAKVFFDSKRKKRIVNRLDFLENLVKNKTVIHFGFLDHNIQTIESKIKSNNWLHHRLIKSAKKCFGVDIDSKLIKELKKRGYNNIYCFNILKNKIPNEITKIKFDYIILGEILEHIGNPQIFLKNLKKLSAKEVVVTVPNAFYIGNFYNALFSNESINSDHRFWFTPYTISKLLSDNHFKLENIYFYSRIPKINFIMRNFLKKYPFFREGIIIIAKLK